MFYKFFLKNFMKYKKLFLGILLLVVLAGVVAPQVVGAASLTGNERGSIFDLLEAVRTPSGLPKEELPTAVVATVVQGLLGIVAVVFFVIVIIAGIKWMLSGGNEETVTKAKQNILNGALGLVVIIFSYAITAIIFNIILNRD